MKNPNREQQDRDAADAGLAPRHSMVVARRREEGGGSVSAADTAGPERLRTLEPPSGASGADWHSVIGDAGIAREIVETLVATKSAGVLRRAFFEARATIVSESGAGLTLELEEGRAVLARDEKLPAALHVCLHGVVFVLEGNLEPTPDGWVLQNPIRVSSMNRRGTARIPVGPGVATLRFGGGSSQQSELRRAAICDLAIDGVGVTETGSRELPRAGFPALVELAGEKIPCFAEVRHESKIGSASRYGLTLQTSKRQALVDGYLRHRFPELISRFDVDEARVSALLDASGYLSLRSETRPPRRWFTLPDTRGLSRDVCYRATDGTIVGHFSITRAYSRAWIGHQMATIKGHSETVDCRRTLYLHVAAFATLMDGEDTTVLGYFDREKPWHKIFFHDFVKWVGNPDLAVIAELDRFERSAPGPIASAPEARPTGVDIGPPSPEELVLATTLIRSQLPELVSDSLDIRPDRIDSESLHDAYRGTPWFRRRSVRVLRLNGKLAGVALCEIGSRELSLFNLFNTAFFFFAGGAAAPSTPAQLALLRHVRNLYAERGEQNPLIVAPPGTFDATAEPGTVLAETMGLIAKSGRSLRQYECFIKYQFGKYLDRHP